MARLAGKTCLVTGAARGIGAAVAAAFVKEGGVVIVSDKDQKEAERTANVLGAHHMLLDVASEDDWARVAERWPAIDVVVNNAGVTGLENGAPHDPEGASLVDWRSVHATNLDGTFLGCRYAIGAMKAKGEGSIVNIASRSGIVGVPAAAAYASSKAAVRNHTRTVALYCAQNGWAIRCNSISPAAIMTPMWAPMLGDGPDRHAREAAIVAETPLKRFGDPKEVAALCVMLASDEAKYATGADFTIDGGLLAGSAASPARQEAD